MPELTGNIEFANQANIVTLLRGKGRALRPGRGLALADDPFDHDVARQPVTEIFTAVETGGVNGDNRYAGGGLRGLAYRFEVIALHGRYAGVIDKDRRRVIAGDDMAHGVKQAAFAAAHNHVLFVEIGGEPEPIKGGAGAGAAAVIP